MTKSTGRVVEKPGDLQPGDEVDFKADIEGRGYVRSVTARRGFCETYYDIVVGATEDPKKADCYPWHPMARTTEPVNGRSESVVYLSPYNIFRVNRRAVRWS